MNPTEAADVTRPTDELSELFRDVVLVLGGVFAVRKTDDETVCQIARGLDRAYRRARGKCSGKAAPLSHRAPDLAPHPAIEGLLRLTDTLETRR